MPNTYIKDSGDWELVQRPWVKDGGSWKPVKKIWIKTDVPQVPTPAIRTVTVSFTKPGNINWQVPLTLVNNSIKVVSIGGGGGGQTGWGNYSSAGGAGAGGSAGNTTKATISVNIGSTLSLVVGRGGLGGSGSFAGGTSAQGPAGGNGSATYITGYSSTDAAGGAGGYKGSSGTYSNSIGNWAGDGGSWWYGFAGQNSSKGNGGLGGTVNKDGENGTFGAGGGGGAASNYNPNDYQTKGGNGGDGAIYITYEETFLGPPPSPWRQVFGNTGTELYDTPGTTSFTVPPGVYSITVGGRKAFDNTDVIIGGRKLNVVPKDVIPVVIGTLGEGASFGSETYASSSFRRTVIYHRGYVDRYLRQTINIVTATGETYASAPYNGLVYPTAGRDNVATIASQAAAKGITITTDLENSWGDLAQEITIAPVLNDGTLPNNITAYVEKIAGRGTVTIEQQPNAANGYKVRILVDDNGPSAADYYEYMVTIDVQPYVSISY
jgi:hypothetical protein